MHAINVLPSSKKKIARFDCGCEAEVKCVIKFFKTWNRKLPPTIILSYQPLITYRKRRKRKIAREIKENFSFQLRKKKYKIKMRMLRAFFEFESGSGWKKNSSSHFETAIAMLQCQNAWQCRSTRAYSKCEMYRQRYSI